MLQKGILDMPKETSHIAARLKKGELHVHLNGLVSSDVVRSILRDEETDIPFGFDLDRDLARRAPCASLSSYLKPWQVLRRIPAKPGNLDRMCDDAFRTLHANRVNFVELRSSILYLANLQGCAAHDAMLRIIESTKTAAAKYGIARGVVMTVTRGDYSAAQLDALLQAYRALGCPRDIVGIDLAGDEEIPVPEGLPAQFRDAKEKFGLGVTIHAGETGRPENIISAIREFGADRIGHGTAAGRHPEVMEELLRRNICVEVCPISNRLTGALQDSEAHPIHEFVRNGVPFVICSDNPGIHEHGLNDDYEAAVTEGLDIPWLERQYAVAMEHTFLRMEK